MRVVLVNPTLDWEKKLFEQNIPLGISYLASIILTKGIEVTIVDSRLIDGPLHEHIPMDADVVGFSAMTFQFKKSLNTCKTLREKGFKGKLVFGGPHASVLPHEVISHKEIDAVFMGEAERSFPLYLDYLQGKVKHEELIRTYVSTPEGIIKGRIHEWIKDLDSLPFPARHLFPLDKIFGDNSDRHLSLISARGCPYTCTFCQPSKTFLFGPKVRRRSVSNIIAEIKDSINKIKINNFGLVDDTFTFSKKYVIRFCEELASSGINLNWGCQSRSTLDLETLQIMKKSGCEHMWIGIESGSQRVLDMMNKETLVENNKTFISNCKKVGIGTLVNVMVGYPGETEEDLDKTIRFIQETDPLQVLVSQTTPFPGTNIYNRDDVIEQDFDQVARHVFQPKFKSMVHLQEKIIETTQRISKVLDSFSISGFNTKEIEKWLHPVPLTGKDLYIFGTSDTGKKISNFLIQRGYSIKEFIDNNFQGMVGEIPIRKPYKPEGDYLFILGSIVFKNQMRKDLEKVGVKPERIIEY